MKSEVRAQSNTVGRLQFLNLEVVVNPQSELTDGQIEYSDDMKIAELQIIDAWYTDRKCDELPKSAMFILDKYRVMNT